MKISELNTICEFCKNNIAEYKLELKPVYEESSKICKTCLQKFGDMIDNMLNYKSEEYIRCDSFCTEFGEERCNRTKEMDRCSCRGNKLKCSHYKYNRKTGKLESKIM